MTGLVRIIGHWTGGPHKATDLDRRHYHFIVEGSGAVVAGNLAPEANLSTADGAYAAHTRGANTGAIGVSMAAMAGARDAPFDWGRAPLTDAQVTAFCRLVAQLAAKYRIQIGPKTVLTHAEVFPALGIRQAGKWDIRVLPGDDRLRPAIEVGEVLRARIRAFQ